MHTTSLRRPRAVALAAISLLIVSAAIASFAESYRALVIWASAHSLHGLWAGIFPLQVDSFIAVGELALFVALADRWSVRSRCGAWAVTALGLAVSVAANVGHVAGHDLASRLTAAVPPLAAAAALAVGLGVLKRVVAWAPEATTQPLSADVLTATSRPSLRLAWPLPPATGTDAAPADRPRATRTVKRSPAKRTARAAAIVAAEQGISGAELGRRLKVSERTGRRLLAGISAG
jgi:hypothetical protein